MSRFERRPGERRKPSWKTPSRGNWQRRAGMGSSPPRARIRRIAYNDMLEERELYPSPEMQALFEAARAHVIAAARAWAARQVLAEELEAEAYAAVAARRVAREAIEAVPVAARSRLTPLRTVQTDLPWFFPPRRSARAGRAARRALLPRPLLRGRISDRRPDQRRLCDVRLRSRRWSIFTALRLRTETT